MTNEQTALLLRQIAGRLRTLAVDVEHLIESAAVETRDHIDTATLETLLATAHARETRPTAVWRILDLAEDLADEAELLRYAPDAAE